MAMSVKDWKQTYIGVGLVGLLFVGSGIWMKVSPDLCVGGCSPDAWQISAGLGAVALFFSLIAYSTYKAELSNQDYSAERVEKTTLSQKPKKENKLLYTIGGIILIMIVGFVLSRLLIALTG